MKLNIKRKASMQPIRSIRAGVGLRDNPSYEMRVRAAPDQTELFVYATAGELVAYSCTTSERELRADRQEFEDDFFPEEEDRRRLRAPDGDWHL